MIGNRLGPYEILAELGNGGMGEVFRARDPRLGREVAVKVLPEAVAASPDRLRRFEQEARAASAINHPNILTVHDVGTASGRSFLVTELLQGESLRDVLQGGGLPIARALEMAIQIARGLAAAHERGIVHRDLKPENLFVTRQGIVKILDFGLAKLTPLGEEGATATTIDGSVTGEGVLLGTVGYMAPEQVRGERVDARADLFALGCVMYEMLAGARAFAGSSAIETLGDILKVDPPAVAERRAEVSALLASVVGRCLAKDPVERFQSARDLGFALELARREVAPGRAEGMATRSSSGWGRRLAMAAAGVAAGAAAILWLSSERAPARRPAAPSAGDFAPLTVDPGYEGQAALSPDGATVAYVADRDGNFDLFLQQVGGGAAINLTHDPADDVQPAISPDGGQIAFVSTRGSRLNLIYRAPTTPLLGGDIWVMPTLGGPPRKVVENGNFPSWSSDGQTLYYARAVWFRSEIRRVPAIGGESTVVPIDLPEGFNPPFLFSPRLSPDGRWLLVSAGDGFMIVPAAGGPAVLLGVGTQAAWEPGGKAIVYCGAGAGGTSNLWWLPFSSESGAATAPAEPLLVGPMELEGPALSGDGRRLLITAVDRDANLESLDLAADSGESGTSPRALTRGHNGISFATAAPDGRSLIYEDRHGSSSHLWRLDADSVPVQLTADAAFEETYPRWSPDGRLVSFGRRKADSPRVPSRGELWLMAPDGGAPRRLADGGNAAWLPDSRRLVFIRGREYHLLDVTTGVEEPLVIDGPEPMPIFTVSPDGAWLVYQTSERGDVDLAVAPISGGRARTLLRTEREDYHPMFSPSGRWLYYQPDHRNLWRIPGPEQGWRVAPPEQVTRFPESGLYLEDPQLSRDGRQFFYSRIQTTADLWVVDLKPARP